MTENAPNEKKDDAELIGEGMEYTGPHRRRTDLPDQGTPHEKGSVRLRTINAVMIALAAVSSLVLLGTIHKKQALIEEMVGAEAPNMELLRALMSRKQWLTGALLLIVIVTIVSVVMLVLRPMDEYISRIREHKMLPMRGSYELRYLAKAYNIMYEENLRRNEELRYKVEHDALTGLYNRGAFEKLRETHQGDDVALLLIDVDLFKGINDTYGHDVGDKMLQKVAFLLDHSFRASDYPCRIGGDEFAVIMTGMTEGRKQVVLDKIEIVKIGLRDTDDGLPAATLSIGVAFSAQRREGEDLFKLADKALYRVKEAGRNGCAFFGDEDR